MLRILCRAAAVLLMLSVAAFIAIILSHQRLLAATRDNTYTEPETGIEDPIESGDIVYDISGTDKGYLVVEPRTDGYACEITKGDEQYVYLLLPMEPNVLPLGMGNGRYRIMLARDAGNSMFEVAVDTEVDVNMSDENAPFTMPNYMVGYSDRSSFLDRAVELTFDVDGRGAVSKVCSWVHRNIVYDRELSEELVKEEAGLNSNIPDNDKTYLERRGVCINQASLTAAMLRIAGIPTRLVTGYHDDEYHAWTESLVDGEWIIADPTAGYTGTDTGSYRSDLYY